MIFSTLERGLDERARVESKIKMTICPYDCGLCSDPACRRDGCRQINETIRLVCDGCGEPVTCVNCLHLCMTCVLVSERKRSPVPLKR